MATKINVRTLLEAGCHFGHQTRRWNPKMKPYIFGERSGIYILDLKQTIMEADSAYTFIKNTCAHGGKVLFVGTKKQAQDAVKASAERANMPYINQRWLGGMLTNFVTLIDTNSDPDVVDYGVPCNDDAISAVALMCDLFADACLAGSGKEQITEAEMTAPAAEQTAELAADAE